MLWTSWLPFHVTQQRMSTCNEGKECLTEAFRHSANSTHSDMGRSPLVYCWISFIILWVIDVYWYIYTSTLYTCNSKKSLFYMNFIDILHLLLNAVVFWFCIQGNFHRYFITPQFLCPPSKKEGHYCYAAVRLSHCLSVGWSVGRSTNNFRSFSSQGFHI